ncbi:hypothetical protein AA313_de0210257 [Arthrobotrys entomopaga]|nr:hypothetical protein AA313_de0210257 [Arthrobotrys entomopaga]
MLDVTMAGKLSHVKSTRVFACPGRCCSVVPLESNQPTTPLLDAVRIHTFLPFSPMHGFHVNNPQTQGSRDLLYNDSVGLDLQICQLLTSRVSSLVVKLNVDRDAWQAAG